MTKNDIQAIMLIPFVILGCIYHKELSDIIGMALNFLFSCIG